jgi:NADH dehydrogenase
VRIGADWFVALLFPPDLVQIGVRAGAGIREQHFETGELVFEKGDVGDCVYVIRQGECDVVRTAEGAEQHLATLKAGEYFGEMAVLGDTSRNATVRAKTPMNVLLISKDDFDHLESNVPVFGELFMALARTRGITRE